MQFLSPNRPQSAGAGAQPKQFGGQHGSGQKPFGGMNGTHQHQQQNQQQPNRGFGGAHQQQQQPRSPHPQQNGFQQRPNPNQPAQQQQPQSHQHNQQRPRPGSAPAPVRNVTVPTAQPKSVPVAGPGTGKYVAFGAPAAGDTQMDVDEMLSGTAVLPRTIAFKKSAASFSSSANFSGAKPPMPPHFAQLQPKKMEHQQQNGNQKHQPQQKQQANGLPPQHKQQLKSPQLQHANQRSPGVKPFSTAALPLNAHGIPVVHDKDPNSFRWPKKYLYPSSTVQALLPWQQFEKIGSGLYNMGNTCFLNAVLQALAYTPPLTNFLRKGEHSRACRLKKEDGQFCLFCALETTVNQMHAHRSSALQPREIVSHLRSISRRFRLGRQEDSHEFLRMAMDMLQANDLATYGGPKRVPDLRMQETTALFGIFGGYLRSQVKCLVCHYRSNTYDAFLDLSLEVTEVSSVAKALHSFTRSEKLDAENLYRCAKCNKKVRAEKSLSIFKAPTVLCVQLKRFQFQSMGFAGMGGMGGGMFGMSGGGGGGGSGGKINKAIQFTEKLSLEAHMSDRHSSPSYSLYAVLVHSGHSVHSGHYYCYVKSSSGLWHCMDDSSVRQVGLAHVLDQRAYMLFYVRDRIETLPVAAPSPGVSPALGPQQTPGAASAAAAAAQEKVKQLNAALAEKKLAALAADQQRKKSKNTGAESASSGDSDEGDSDEDEDDDDASYQSGDSDEGDSEEEQEEASDEDENDDEGSDAADMEEVEDADQDQDMDDDADSQIDDDMPGGSSSFSFSGAMLLRRSRARHLTMRTLGLLPGRMGLPRYCMPPIDLQQRPPRDQPEGSDDDDEEEADSAPAVPLSNKRKRLLEEMAAEVADLSEDDELESDEEIESSDEEDAGMPIPVHQKKQSKSTPAAAVAAAAVEKPSKKSDKHDAKRAKSDSSAASASASGSVGAPAKPAPAPFWFTAEAEAAAKNGQPPTGPIQFSFSFGDKSNTTAPAATAATPAAPKPTNTFSAPPPAPAAALPASVPSAVAPSKPQQVGPIVLSREAFDPRLLNRQYRESQFGAQVGDWDSTVASVEATREKYAMKRKQDLANQALTPQTKEKDAWDEELDKGHVRKLKNRDSLTAAGVHAHTGANLFQTTQNARNRTKDAIRSGAQPEEHKGKGGSDKKKRGASRGLAAKGHRSHKERNAERKAGGSKNSNAPRGLRDF